MRAIRSTQLRRLFSNSEIPLLSSVMGISGDPSQPKSVGVKSIDFQGVLENFFSRNPKNLLENLDILTGMINPSKMNFSDMHMFAYYFLKSDQIRENIPHKLLISILTYLSDNITEIYSLGASKDDRAEILGTLYVGFKMSLIQRGKREHVMNIILDVENKLKTNLKSVYFYELLLLERRLHLYILQHGMRYQVPSSPAELLLCWRILMRVDDGKLLVSNFLTSLEFLKDKPPNEFVTDSDIYQYTGILISTLNHVENKSTSSILEVLSIDQRQNINFFLDYYSSIFDEFDGLGFNEIRKINFLFKTLQGNRLILRRTIGLDDKITSVRALQYFEEDNKLDPSLFSNLRISTMIEIMYYLTKEGRLGSGDTLAIKLIQFLKLYQSNSETFLLRPDSFSKLIHVLYTYFDNEIDIELDLISKKIPPSNTSTRPLELLELIDSFWVKSEVDFARVIGKNKLSLGPVYKTFMLCAHFRRGENIKPSQEVAERHLGRLQFMVAFLIRFNNEFTERESAWLSNIHKFLVQEKKGGRNLRALIEAALSNEPQSHLNQLYEKTKKVKKVNLKYDKFRN